MDPKKKKMVWSNLREKTKLFNVKRSKDKPKKSNLRYRRSISVPNLMLDLLENGSLDVEHPSPDPDTIFFSVEPSDSEVSSLGYTEDVSAPSTPPLVRPSLSEAPALMERRPALTEVPVFREPKPVKSGAGKDRATTWYVTGADPPSLSVPDGKESGPLPVPAERRSSPAARTSVDGGSVGSEGTEKLVSALSRAHGGVDRLTPPARPRIPPDRLSLPTEMSDWNSTESMNSTPSEERTSVFWPSESDPALAVEPSSPVSNYMFITGSAENLLELVPNESNDYDASDLQAEKSNESQPAGGQKIQYLLTINLKEGRGLVARDRLGTSDPYVKFKLDSKTCYKSKVVNKTLNPTWNESFSFPVRDLEQNICVKVYDRDLRSHDFMGCSSFILNKLELDKTTEMVLRLEDPNSVEDNMGVIIIDACLSVRDGPTKRRWLLKRRGSINKGQPQSPPPAHRAQSNQKGQVWTGVYTILLVEGQDMPDCGQGDIYVRFRLGEQKFKSKNLCVKANPQWRETFDFNHFEDGLDLLQVEVCVKRGRKAEECWGMLDIDLSRGPVRQRQLYTRVLDPGKGRLVFLVTLTPCSGASISDLQSPPLDQPATFESMVEQYNILNSLKNMKDVGYLQVKLIKATDLLSTDLSGKSDPFCVLELGNSKLQSHTIHKTLNPEWKTVFTFPIKDIHDVLVLTVFDDDGDKPADFLGKAAIPLLRVTNGQQITRTLKKQNLTGTTKGKICLEMEVLYNPVRAGIKTFEPKEMKFLEDNPKFNKKLLARNIYRVRRLSTAVLCTLQYIKSCFQWESTQRSIIAFLMFVLMVLHWELFMFPLFLLLLIGWNYFHMTQGVASYSQDLESLSVAEDEEEEDKDSEKRGLMEKIHMVQEIVLTVQNTLDEAACVGERIKNTFNWSVPFLSILAGLVLFLATAALYCVPLRYIVLLWGVNKFTKKLRNPYGIDNNEVLDFLKRVPSDVQKVQYSEPRVPAIQSQPKKKR